MSKIGQFIYPWGNGHYFRMMRLNQVLRKCLDNKTEIHFATKSPIYEKLLEKFPENRQNIHEILMPTPIDGKYGPSISRSLFNILLPISKNPPLIKQISSYLKEERRLFDNEKFDLVINDGDMGANVLASNRGVPSLFITNQFMPKLWKSRSYFYPSLIFIAKQIAKATKILVADSEPPYTICEYNLNFPKKIMEKVCFVGHFVNKEIIKHDKSDLEKLIQGTEFGYWMRTGNKSTNDGTGEKYNKVFGQYEMRQEKRIISHAKNNSAIDSVTDKNGKKYSISDAIDKKIDWIQIDVGFLTEQEKDSVLEQSKYAVINGSHTVMGEIMGIKLRPIIGIPVYDEHTNQIKWAEKKNLGILANNTKQVLNAINKIKDESGIFEEGLEDFSKNFNANGAKNSAKIAVDILEKKK